MLVISSVVVTISVAPIVTSIYRPARRFTPYKRRTIQRTRVEQELRVLVGIHNPRTVPSIINFLEATHPTKRSPVFVFALHLVELTGRASAMMIAHNSRKNGRAPVNRTQANSDQIASAFENYQQQSLGVSAATLTAISPYSSMHEDICDLAEGKRAALILLPFHKEQTVDGSMESTNPAFRTINSSVLANAPCSVGILIDRGLGGAANRITSSTLFNQVSQYVGVLFFGGPDDREALACACRMAEHPSICLTIVRFIEDTTAHLSSRSSSSSLLRGGEAGDTKMLTLTTDEEKERQLDEDYVNQFRLRHASNESVVYVEKVVRNSEETVATIRGLDNVYDLFIVGRGQGFSTPLTAGLTDWSECPELGPIGDLLASSDYAATVTVLVVQQYVGATPGEGVGTPDSPGVHLDHYLDDHLRRPQSQGSPF
ncbi:Cation/H(+) antiporter 15 [Asimina triloba]